MCVCLPRLPFAHAEHETRAALSKLWREKEESEVRRDPSFAAIPRFFVPKSKPPAGAPSAVDVAGACTCSSSFTCRRS